MEPWLIGKLLSPFFVLVLACVVLVPCRVLIQRKMRPGRLKRFLLSESPALRLGFLFAVLVALILSAPYIGLY